MWPALIMALQAAQGQQNKENQGLGGAKPVNLGEGLADKTVQPSTAGGGGFLSMLMNQMGQQKTATPGQTPGGYGKVGTF